jgi:hypothetical protein
MTKKEEEQKEDFCPACVSIPLAFLGAGTSAYGLKGSYKKQKKILFWVGISMVLLSIFIAVYYLWIKKCEECR